MKRYRFIVPNAVTALRFILTALFVCLLAGLPAKSAEPFGLYAVYALICLSDLLDGAAARALRAESALGGILDVSADSLFIFSSFVFFNFLGVLPVWFSAVVAADFLVFLVTSGTLIRKKPASARRVFVFDAAGRAAAVLFYVVPIAACAVYDRGDGRSSLLFYVLLGLAALLAAVSMMGRGVACLSAWRCGKRDTET